MMRPWFICGLAILRVLAAAASPLPVSAQPPRQPGLAVVSDNATGGYLTVRSAGESAWALVADRAGMALGLSKLAQIPSLFRGRSPPARIV
jgi:hypothetical protein